jgi:hypothetical protein
MQRRPNGGGSNNGGSNNGRRPQSSNGGVRRSGGNMNAAAAAGARDKYLEKAKEAMSEGDRVLAENYFQHADHYSRIVLEAEERRQDDAFENEKNDEVNGSVALTEAQGDAAIPAQIVPEVLINKDLTGFSEEVAL